MEISLNLADFTGFFLNRNVILTMLHLLLTMLYLWRLGVIVITTAKLHSTKSELTLCAGSNPARDVSEIRDAEDLR